MSVRPTVKSKLRYFVKLHMSKFLNKPLVFDPSVVFGFQMVYVSVYIRGVKKEDVPTRQQQRT